MMAKTRRTGPPTFDLLLAKHEPIKAPPFQVEARERIGFGPILIQRIGDVIVVAVETPTGFVEVLREDQPGDFCLVAEPDEIERAIQRTGGEAA